MSGTRLQALQSAFAGFGGAFASLNTMIRSSQEVEQIEARVDHQIAMQGIQRDNERIGNQAAADASAGRPADPAMNDQRAYRDTFAAVSGQRQGFALADRWDREVRTQVPIGGDLRAATDRWLRDTVGRGSGDPTFDRHALDVLNRAVDRGMSAHREEGTRAVVEQGTENLRGLIGQAISSGNWTPEDIGRWTTQAATLARGDRNRAQAFVTGAILGAARSGDVEGAQRILSALQQPGSGREGRAWRDDNEQAYITLEGQLTERVRHTRTVTGAAAYNQIEDRIAAARTPAEVVAIREDIERVHGQYGGAEDRQRVERALLTRAAPLIRQEENVNRLRVWAVTGGADPSVVRENIDAYFASVPHDPRNPSAGLGISIASHPEQAGTLASRLGAISDTMGAQLRQMLADTANPDGQAAAIRFLRTVEGSRGGSRDFALTMIPEEHRGAYRVISDTLTSTNLPVERVVERINAIGGNDAERNLRETTWQRLYPRESDQAKAEARMRSQIASGLREHIGESGSIIPGSNYSVSVDGALQGALEANAHSAAVFARQIGADVDQAVRGSIRDLQSRVDLLPMPDGNVRAVLRRDGVGQDGAATQTHSDGAPRVRGGITVRNPATGNEENTLATAQTDLRTGQRLFNGLFEGGGRMALGDDPTLAAMGLRPVVHSGNSSHVAGAVILEGGREVNLGGERIRIPTNPEEAAALLTQHFQRIEGTARSTTGADQAPVSDADTPGGMGVRTRPRDAGVTTNGAETRFRIVPQQTVVNGEQVTIYRLAYRFGFRERTITAEERARQ